MATNEKAKSDEINERVSHWRQGDCVTKPQYFIHRFDTEYPLTDEAQSVAENSNDLVETEVRGFAILTQTCDIVRDCNDRQYIEVAPLVEVEEDELEKIRKGEFPRYGYISGVAEKNLVADLDRIMTVEKSVVAKWDQTKGCHSDEESRIYAEAVARKFRRFPFPTDFYEIISKFRSRLVKKHGRQSDEGKALQALREIRISADPSWSADSIELTVWFVKNDSTEIDEDSWNKQRELWLSLISPSGRFKEISGLVTTLDDMTATDYVTSDPMDLDHLSASSTSQ